MQQQPVAAAHHPDTVSDKTTGLVLARVDLEILLRAVEAKQDFGDGAVTLAMKASIKRPQGEDVPLPELSWQRAKITARRSTANRAPEPAGGVSTQFEKGIHGQGYGVESSRVRNSVRQPELMCGAIDLPDTMPTVCRAAQVETIEMRKRDGCFRLAVAILHRRKHYSLWLKARIPEQGLPVGRRFRIGGKTGAPSVA